MFYNNKPFLYVIDGKQTFLFLQSQLSQVVWVSKKLYSELLQTLVYLASHVSPSRKYKLSPRRYTASPRETGDFENIIHLLVLNTDTFYLFRIDGNIMSLKLHKLYLFLKNYMTLMTVVQSFLQIFFDSFQLFFID